MQNSAPVVTTTNTVDNLPNTAEYSATNVKGKEPERSPNPVSAVTSKMQDTQSNRAQSCMSNATATTAQYLEYEQQLQRN